MKRIITFILAVCLCMGIMLPIQATSVMTVSGEAVTVSPGEKFAVNVSVTNNPGFAYLKIQLDYDPELFTFNADEAVSASDALVLAAGETLISWDASANYSDDAVIGTLYFAASESIAAGEYEIGVTVVECYNIDTDDVQATAVDSTITVQTVEAQSSIAHADMELGTDITVNYYATLDPSHAGAQMRFTMNGRETVVDGVATDNDSEYEYAFKGVSPQCMGDNIKAELVLDGAVLATKDDYSVLQYCKNMLASSPEALEISQDKFDAMKTLIADLLEYGAKAQLYKNYKTNELVNKDIIGASEFTELTSTVKKAGSTSVPGVKFTAVGVYFDFTNALFVKFTAPDIDGDALRINFNNTTYYMLSECELIDAATSTYLVRLDNVSVLDYGTSFNITIESYDADWEEWNAAQRLRYSVNSYVYSMQSSEKLTMADLAKALYNYGVSATAYNNAE